MTTEFLFTLAPLTTSGKINLPVVQNIKDEKVNSSFFFKIEQFPDVMRHTAIIGFKFNNTKTVQFENRRNYFLLKIQKVVQLLIRILKQLPCHHPLIHRLYLEVAE